jgi:hypothetical protein
LPLDDNVDVLDAFARPADGGAVGDPEKDMSTTPRGGHVGRIFVGIQAVRSAPRRSGLYEGKILDGRNRALPELVEAAPCCFDTLVK